MRSYSRYWLIAKISFITPRRISRLRLPTTQLLLFISYLIKKAEVMQSSMDTFLSCRLMPGAELQASMKWKTWALTAVRLLHSAILFMFPIVQKNIGVQKMAQFLVMFSHSVSTLGEKGAKTGRRAAGGERVAVNFKKCHFPWGWDRNALMFLVLTEHLNTISAGKMNYTITC